MKTRICHMCGTEVGAEETCEICVEALKWYPDPKSMTPEERVAELYLWYHPAILEVPFGMMHERIEALVGRGIFTHELIEYDQLSHEILQYNGEYTATQVESLMFAGLDRLAKKYPQMKLIIFDTNKNDINSFPPSDEMPNRPEASTN